MYVNVCDYMIECDVFFLSLCGVVIIWNTSDAALESVRGSGGLET